MAGIPLDKAYLTAIWLETLFYGINLLLFCGYLFIAKYKRKTALPKVILYTAILMFCFSTIHVSLGFQRLIEGFIYLRDEPGGPAAFFSNVSIPANVAKVTIHTVNSILGDSIVVWRCYHVWGKDWKICAFPILLIVASAVCGFGQSAVFAEGKEFHSAFVSTLQKWNGSLFAISLVTNVTVTSLVAFRIWWIARSINVGFATPTSFKYRRVLTIVVESGAIYSTAVAIEIALYFSNSNAFYIVYDPIAQLTGIVPTMIIVMTSLGMTSEDLNDEESRMAVESRIDFNAPPKSRRVRALPTESSWSMNTIDRSVAKETMTFAAEPQP